MDNNQVREIVFGVLGGNMAINITQLATAVKVHSVWVALKFSALPIVGKIVGLSFAGWIASQAYTIAENLFTAAVWNKGVKWGIGVSWGIIPTLTGSVR